MEIVNNSEALIEAQGLSRFYTVKSGFFGKTSTVRALSNTSFTLSAGKTLAVVGESGCGKSTLARVLTMIEPPSAGSVRVDEIKVVADPENEVQPTTHPESVQIVFQDPFGSLNPRQKIGRILEEPLVINQPGMARQERVQAVRDMLELVGLRPEHFDRYPHMFSGGQRQRIAIARALMLRPKILILDEPVSALDLSIQSQILNLLVDLQEKFNLAYLFISHDLSVVRHVADDILVMYLGRVVEAGTSESIFTSPKHPYTAALLSATPVADPARKRQRIHLEGELPSPLSPPSGCAFHPRCWLAKESCRTISPELTGPVAHQVSCHFPLDGSDE